MRITPRKFGSAFLTSVTLVSALGLAAPTLGAEDPQAPAKTAASRTIDPFSDFSPIRETYGQGGTYYTFSRESTGARYTFFLSDSGDIFKDGPTGDPVAHADPSGQGEPTGTGERGYTWSATGWYLDRAETLELRETGSNLALLYAIGTAIGCKQCAVGAATEGLWAQKAGEYYARGNCIKINYWLTVSEVKSGTHNCK